MTDYGRVRSKVKPAPQVIDEYSVWMNTDIMEITNEDGTFYEYGMKQYAKDEYIALLDEKNAALESDVEANAEAIEELAALIGGNVE